GRVKIGGEVAGELLLFPDDLSDGKAVEADWGNIVKAKLNFGVSASNAEAVLNFNLSPETIISLGKASSEPFQTPMIIDEAYLRAFLGKVTLETGFRKLSWGRADIQGPLNVTNPLDYTDLTNVSDVMGRKIARPMVHASVNLGYTAKVEGVFIPSFQGHRYSIDSKERWFPTAISTDRAGDMKDGIASRINLPAPYKQQIVAGLNAYPISFANLIPTDVNGLGYAQGGLRFSTTVGPADVGAQYYSGNLFRPSMVIEGADEFIYTANTDPTIFLTNPNYTKETINPKMRYNRYHQVGFDYAQVIFDFSVRAELAANITGDHKGDDGGVYNPSLAWSLGFDRDVCGFTFFLEADESIRLLNDKVGKNPATDTEAGTPLTATSITTQISRAFFQEKLELKCAILWNVETSDIYLMPSLSYTMGDLEAVFSGGIFAGKDGGELSQYRDNGYIKTVLTYSF
ncbi:MAG: hypothetical protein LBT39_00815, partial [Treponema sp.]|nr:hypothetical protein [Treponema sp.]